jgi:hypothetical protein
MVALFVIGQAISVLSSFARTFLPRTHATSSFRQLPSIQPSPLKNGKTSSARAPLLVLLDIPLPPIPGEVIVPLVLVLVLAFVCDRSRIVADLTARSFGVGTKASDSLSSWKILIPLLLV